MNVYKVEKQDQLSGPSYQPGQAAPAEKPQPLYFDTLENAEKYLSETFSCDTKKVLGNPQDRIYQSHNGNFVVTELSVRS